MAAMTMEQDPAACGNCGVERRRLLLLHRVLHRHEFRRLCTSCVLRLHTASFCPACFDVHDQATPDDDVVSCSECHSHTHPRCLLASKNPTNIEPFICSSCESPNSLAFESKSERNSSGIDEKAARLLLAAARVAAGSVNKAAEAAVLVAERRAREAALARKRAREALENVAFLVAREKLRKSGEVSSTGIEDSDRKRVSSGNGNEGSCGELGQLELESGNADREKVINGRFSGLAVGDQLQQH